MLEDHRREDDDESSMENRIVCEEYRRKIMRDVWRRGWWGREIEEIMMIRKV